MTGINSKALYHCSSLKEARIGKYVKTIGARAFEGCTALVRLIIKTTGLSGSSVKANAFRNTPEKMTVWAPARKASSYKKILTGRGLSKKSKWGKL